MALGSIVDYLKSQGKDSSYGSRKKIAEQYGITNYSGTAAQNTALLGMLQKGETGNRGPSPNVTAGVNQGPGASQAEFSASGSAMAPRSGYNRSERVNEYYNKLQDKEGNRPDAFESRYEDEISSILDNILNRPAFSYTSDDLVNDDLYKMYRDNYMRQGSMAMRDTMGNAAGLTGGYGNTYASAAGQQAYDNYLAALNDKSLEFADRAYDRYRDDTADNYNQLSAVQGLDNTDYSRYRDDVSDYYQDLNYLNGRYNQEYGYDFGEYQDQIAQQQWAQEFALQQQQAAAAAARGSSGGGSSSVGSKEKSTATEQSSSKLSVNDAVSILDQIKRSEGLKAAIAEAQRMIEQDQLADEKGDLTPAERIARMIDQWQYMQNDAIRQNTEVAAELARNVTNKMLKSKGRLR